MFFSRNAFTSSFIKTLKATVKPKIAKIQVQDFHAKNKRAATKKMQRKWEHIDPDAEQQQMQNDLIQYKLLSYNILAQDLLTEHLHLYMNIEPQLLRWEHRMRRLKTEIQQLDPDILCLQEMQFNHIKMFVKQIRGCRKLEYVFKKKTGHRSDGCAIIYDKEKFLLLEERGIEYFNPCIANLNRENIALLTKFRLRAQPDKDIVVATTHLLYNPKREDVRMAQVQVLLRELNEFCVKDRCGGGRQLRLPIVLTGDFNFEPSSPPHAMLTHANTETQWNSEHGGVGRNQLKMRSLGFGSSSASTLQHAWIIVDYILHSTGQSTDNIKIWSIYKLPTVKDCQQYGKIPNRYLGSDHFSLAVTFSAL